MFRNTSEKELAKEEPKVIVKATYMAIYNFCCDLYAPPAYKLNGDMAHDARNDELNFLAGVALGITKENGWITEEEREKAMDDLYKIQWID
ncbi:MAG: hypothetical protein IJ655_04415 [Lachnospiraceae bacterium]|nr:hypothetical protein [Lachnospiraceae bacterium]